MTLTDPSGPPPVIHIDESGNTGQNLADFAQPVFAFGAVHLDDKSASRLATALAGEADEAHYTRRRKTKAGRERVLTALTDEALRPNDTARVSVMHKITMIVAKFVDLLIEPAANDRGIDMYANGGVLIATDLLLAFGATAWTATWASLLEAFATVARLPEPATASTLFDALTATIAEASEHPVHHILTMALASPAELYARLHIDDDHPADHLYPEVGLIGEEISWWGEHLGASVEAIYDESRILARWRERLLSLSDPAVAAHYQITPSTGVDPLPLAGMNAAVSHETPQLQIADTVVGACAEVLRSYARAETPSPWIAQLREIGVLNFVGHWVWRGPSTPPEVASAGEVIANS